ncbi:hypothetical protein SAMN05421812_120123 [Asanoa hainanensis]|uniref:Uncharacterized protein n=1 Tax=Asanoa hainanensis TaxID=560556 RepID=A0A239PEW9_9ACTN|nr:hypothetical protein [Asanoa hainanensis]SNT65198.1 hypothetical protein SAMN05421812_120123 [Asanoa hainanensis]
MLTPHRTREHWHIPTPFSAADGGPISLRLARPNLNWLFFVVGGINVAEAALTAVHMEHHTAVRIAAHSVSVALAVLLAWCVDRSAARERLARAGMVISALPAVYLPASEGPLLLPTIFIGAAVVVTVAGEVGYRVSRKCRCGERS